MKVQSWLEVFTQSWLADPAGKVCAVAKFRQAVSRLGGSQAQHSEDSLHRLMLGARLRHGRVTRAEVLKRPGYKAQALQSEQC